MWGFVLICYLSSSGASPTDEQGNAIKDEFSDLPFPQQYIYRIFKELEYVKKVTFVST